MTKVYDRNRNELTIGQRVMISDSGETDQIEQIAAQGLSPYDAEHQPCITLKKGRFAPINLIKLG